MWYPLGGVSARFVGFARKVGLEAERSSDLFDGDLRARRLGRWRRIADGRFEVDLELSSPVLAEDLVETDAHGRGSALQCVDELLGEAEGVDREPGLLAEDPAEAVPLATGSEHVELQLVPEHRLDLEGSERPRGPGGRRIGASRRCCLPRRRGR